MRQVIGPARPARVVTLALIASLTVGRMGTLKGTEAEQARPAAVGLKL